MRTEADQSPSDDAAPPVLDWGACLAEHEPWLRKVIRSRTGEAQAVDEVFQQVAVAALEQKSPLADRSKAAPWLHRLAVVHSARYRRKLGRHRKALRHVGEQLPHLANGYADNALSWLVAQERYEQTRLAMARLNGADAEILMLKYGEQWSYRQIAERLGISEKAVDSRLLRARGRLREQLIPLGINEQDT